MGESVASLGWAASTTRGIRAVWDSEPVALTPQWWQDQIPLQEPIFEAQLFLLTGPQHDLRGHPCILNSYMMIKPYA